ncbi:SulP family inorganic anion transporter [Dysgonomonas sp. 25]|uniref:SulP family inorganic anion transporter n=1 Tax=Dysgonomonas sp. 25 TaxID=2302933 RepID=UPI0013D5254E|nr:SulP family inorganic anion transporter [Dysgonomonas sp. 25]NDV67292.1 STAS domain-containing protein [Dysgonomonas sp. 25]
MKKDIRSHFTPQLFTSLKTYNKQKFANDLMSGLIVGIVALPLALAFGIASGVSPEKGLLTSIVAGFVISFLGGSTVQIGGPTGAFIVIVYNTIQTYGFEGLVVVTVMSGIMLILMGIMRLGVVIKFIPYPIIVGYMSGIAVIIFSTQMKDFFGMTINETIPPDFIGKWIVYIRNFPSTDIPTLIIGILSLVIIIFSGKISKKIPGSLLAVVFISVVVYILRYHCGIESIATIGDKFDLGGNLFQLPSGLNVNMDLINALFPTAFTLAMLGSIESLISTSVADGVTGEKSHSNMELIAQGVANIASPLLGGIPATGALARTMTNVSNGGRTPVAGIVHALFLLLVVLFLGQLTKHIPMVCLAAILIVVSYNMSEWRSFVDLLRNSKADVAVLLATFILTLVFDLTVAIEIGLLMAVFLFLKRMNEVARVSVIKNKLDLSHEGEFGHDDEKLDLPKEVEVYEIDGPFFFGIANKFDESMRIIGDKAKIRIIRMRKVPFMDSTGLHNLESLCEKSIDDGITVILSGVRPEVHQMIEKSKIPAMIGEGNICGNIGAALDRAYYLLDKAKEESML